MLIPRTVLSASQVFCDTGSTRYALGGVHLCRTAEGAPEAHACDGSYLLASTWGELKGVDNRAKAGFSTILPADACQRAAKLGNPKKADLKTDAGAVVSLEEGSANGRVVVSTLGHLPATATEESLEGRYPKVSHVFPRVSSYSEVSQVRLDAYRLADLAKAVADIAGEGERGVSVLLTIGAGQDGHERPITISATHDGVTASGVIMPLATIGHKNSDPREPVLDEEGNPVTDDTGTIQRKPWPVWVPKGPEEITRE